MAACPPGRPNLESPFPMRVLHVYKDYAPVRGGIEHHVQLLAEGLCARGFDARVLVTNTQRRTEQLVVGGVPVTKAGRLASLQSAPISLAFYPAFLRLSAEAEVVHLHLPYPPAELGQLFWGRARHSVVTYHSDIVRQRLLGALYRPLQRQLLARVEAISVSNPRSIASSRQLPPFAAKCVVIPHGIDVQRFRPTPANLARAAAIRATHGPGGLILTVGRLRHYKGIDVLIRAMPQLDGQALIVGRGPLETAWHRLATECGVASRVHFLGEVDHQELVALYHAADVFVLPSTNRAETWGTVQIEAMACALPVVCTELGTGTSYVNQHEVTGLVVPPGDAAALAAALRRLLANPAERRQFGEAGRRRAQRELSAEAMLQATLTLYQKLAGTR